MGLSLYGTHKVEGQQPAALNNIVVPSFGDSIVIVIGSTVSTGTNPNQLQNMIFQTISLTRIVDQAVQDPSENNNGLYVGYMFPTSAGTSNLTICYDENRNADTCITAFVYTGAKQEAPHTAVQGAHTGITANLTTMVGDIGNLGMMAVSYNKLADLTYTWDDGSPATTALTDDYNAVDGYGSGIGASSRIVVASPWSAKGVLSAGPNGTCYGAMAFKHIPGNLSQIITAV